MSTVVYFDIRNFTTHVSHLASKKSRNSDRIFKVVEAVFDCLDKAIKACHEKVGIKRETYVNHTGDGFVAIFYGK
jgi:class 3 adenylate cyclase